MSHQHLHAPDELHDHDLGLSNDLPKIAERGLGRRRMLGIFGGLGVAAVAGCAADLGTSTTTATDSSRPEPPDGGPGGAPPGGESTVEVADNEIPEETAGPFPGDGSNGPNLLTESGVIRSDITSSFGTGSAVAEGVPLTINLKVLDTNGDDVAPLAGAAVYLWHCDRDGNYSMYSDSVVEENYLRGVQESAADGSLSFTSIFPGAYSGRWPHVHFEVYPSLAEATTASNKMRTSQLALPEDVCLEVYENGEGYEQSLTNVAQTPLESDIVFADGYSLQMAKVTGAVEDGYVATLNVPV